MKGSASTEWTGGFWKNRWDACRDKMIPHMWGVLMDKDVSHCWQNFLIASGQAEGEHSGPPFWDGDLYKWLESAIRAYATSDNKEWLDRIDMIIDTIAQVQREDGYIFTYDAIQRRNNGEYSDLENDNNFEVYNMGHLMSAGVVHHKLTGQTKLLDLGKNAARYLKKQFVEAENVKARTAVCPSHYMGLSELYQSTGDEQYLDLLETLIQLRDQVTNGTDDNQDRIPLKEHREILGHGVRATYLYAGVADLYMGKGDEDYVPVLTSVWNDMVSKKSYITGGCAPLYDGVSPYGSWDHEGIQRTHQSFGRAYELPNTAGYNETCASIGSYLWNYRMARAFGDGKYGDHMERSLYNSVISGISLEGDKYFYTNALRCVHDLPYELKWSRHREEFISSFCCPPNVLRTITGSPDKAVLVQDDGGIAFLVYGDCQTTLTLPDGSTAKLKVSTDYPWSGEIEVTIEEINAKAAIPIRLRIPGWAGGFEVSVNGEPVENTSNAAQGFVELKRDWHSGDHVQLTLPMEVMAVESHPMVEESRNHVAIVRGPIVYCLETVDLPNGGDILDVHIDPDTTFTPKKTTMNGAEIVALEGDLWVRKDANWTGDTLYRKHGAQEFEKVKASLVPYFTWDNRQEGEMTVWLPVLPAGAGN